MIRSENDLTKRMREGTCEKTTRNTIMPLTYVVLIVTLNSSHVLDTVLS